MKKYCILFILFFVVQQLAAQRGPNDTIRVGAIVIGKDTFIHKWLPEVYVREKAPRWYAKEMRRKREERAAYDRLRYNVYLVYPYAVSASYILKDVDSVLDHLNSRLAKQDYKRHKEEELNKKFKNELTDMSIAQGQILVKLISRQTGRSCYSIIKDLKGGLNARIFQTVALLFDNNLRNQYDAKGEDEVIEQIVQEIEASGHFEPRLK